MLLQEIPNEVYLKYKAGVTFRELMETYSISLSTLDKFLKSREREDRESDPLYQMISSIVAKMGSSTVKRSSAGIYNNLHANDIHTIEDLRSRDLRSIRRIGGELAMEVISIIKFGSSNGKLFDGLSSVDLDRITYLSNLDIRAYMSGDLQLTETEVKKLTVCKDCVVRPVSQYISIVLKNSDVKSKCSILVELARKHSNYSTEELTKELVNVLY